MKKPLPNPPIGATFGDWTVIETDLLKTGPDRIRPACRVRCSCGRETICASTTLRKGISTRCKRCAWARTSIKKRGYQQRANPMLLVGAKFGRWTVAENGLYLGKIRAVRVVCECGTERVKNYFQLRNGASTSCGCHRRRSIEGTWKLIYRNLCLRGKDCHLTLPQVKAIAQLSCAYCGIEPSNVMRRKCGYGEKREYDPQLDVRYSGIDRVDSSLGYVAGNVVPCCARCNVAKSSLSVEEFLAMLSRIRAHNPTVAGIRDLALSLF